MVAQEKIDLLRKKIDEADAIVVGGASGMSAASGFKFYYQCDDVFRRIAGSLEQKYGSITSLTGFYYHQHTHGASIGPRPARQNIFTSVKPEVPIKTLPELLRGKNYYIATTNQDAQVSASFRQSVTRIQATGGIGNAKMSRYYEIYYNRSRYSRLPRR